MLTRETKKKHSAFSIRLLVELPLSDQILAYVSEYVCVCNYVCLSPFEALSRPNRHHDNTKSIKLYILCIKKQKYRLLILDIKSNIQNKQL